MRWKAKSLICLGWQIRRSILLWLGRWWLVIIIWSIDHQPTLPYARKSRPVVAAWRVWLWSWASGGHQQGQCYMYQQSSFHRLSHSQLSDDLHARRATEKRRKMEAPNNLLKIIQDITNQLADLSLILAPSRQQPKDKSFPTPTHFWGGGGWGGGWVWV